MDDIWSLLGLLALTGSHGLPVRGACAQSFFLSVSVPLKPSLFTPSVCPTFFFSHLQILNSHQDQEHLPLIGICSLKFTSPLRKANPEKTWTLLWGPVLKVISLSAGLIQEVLHGKDGGLYVQTWVQILSLPLANCEILGKSPHLTKPFSFPLYNQWHEKHIKFYLCQEDFSTKGSY